MAWDQDIAIRQLMLKIKYDADIPTEYQGFCRQYLSLMYAVAFDAGRVWVYNRYSKKKTAVILYDASGTRIAQYESVAQAAKATKTDRDVIFHALKTHKKTRQGQYWTKVY